MEVKTQTKGGRTPEMCFTCSAIFAGALTLRAHLDETVQQETV